MLVKELEEKLWPYIEKELKNEQVASLDHIRRTVARAWQLGRQLNARMEVLIPGAMLHDIGVVTDRKRHYLKGKERAAEILNEIGYPREMVDDVLHVMEAHSRYGGIPPQTLEAKIMRDIDAIDYVGAVGVARAVVRGLNDGSFDGNIGHLPTLLKKIAQGMEGGIFFEQSRKIVDERIKIMENYLSQLESELNGG